MRFLLQRVSRASVTVAGEVTGAIQKGLLVLVGIGEGDSEREALAMIDKLVNLRIFADDQGRMNLSALQVGGQLLLVSQFTLYGDCRKGRRPSFEHAASPEHARQLYDFIVENARASGLKVGTGVFREHMDVELVNDGPITILLDSAELFSAK
jgi:D-tyrosyl-tRNA(Tyr) deacylase